MTNKTMAAAGSSAVFLLFAMLLASTTWAQTSDKSPLNLDEQGFHRRAVEAAYWGMPTVNIWAMREGLNLKKANDKGVSSEK